MKKLVTKLFSLLMALCMTAALLVPSALAAGSSDDAELQTGLTFIPATSSVVMAGGEDVSSRAVVVPNGARIGVQYISVYPAYYDAAQGFGYDSAIYAKATYPAANEQTKTLRLSPSETANQLAKFKAKYGIDANAWILDTTFSIYLDGKGSYGKYFEFDTEGNCPAGATIRLDLNRTTTSASFKVGFLMPENTSGRYDISLWGGFYYYSAYAKKDLSSMAGVAACFNM